MPSLPEGSDIFQRVLQQICDSCENCKQELADENNNIKRSSKADHLEVSSADTTDSNVCKCRGGMSKNKHKFYSLIRMQGGKQSHVQWADESENVPLAYEADEHEKHSARIFVKTMPKSILKTSKGKSEISVS